jgi:hypothetical protein
MPVARSAARPSNAARWRAAPGSSPARQFAELLCQRIAASHALYQGNRDTFEETLRRLSFERIIPRKIAEVFHALRKAGNIAGHEAKGSHSDALSALKFARQLGIWFHRTYGREPGFKAGAFIPPPEPVDGMGGSGDFTFAGGPWGHHKVPFVFAANGRPYSMAFKWAPSIAEKGSAGTDDISFTLGRQEQIAAFEKA